MIRRLLFVLLLVTPALAEPGRLEFIGEPASPPPCSPIITSDLTDAKALLVYTGDGPCPNDGTTLAVMCFGPCPPRTCPRREVLGFDSVDKALCYARGLDQWAEPVLIAVGRAVALRLDRTVTERTETKVIEDVRTEWVMPPGGESR